MNGKSKRNRILSETEYFISLIDSKLL